MFLMLCYSLGLFSILCYKYFVIFSVWVPEEQKTTQILFHVQAERTAWHCIAVWFNSVNDGCGKIPKDKYLCFRELCAHNDISYLKNALYSLHDTQDFDFSEGLDFIALGQ